MKKSKWIVIESWYSVESNDFFEISIHEKSGVVSALYAGFEKVKDFKSVKAARKYAGKHGYCEVRAC